MTKGDESVDAPEVAGSFEYPPQLTGCGKPIQRLCYKYSCQGLPINRPTAHPLGCRTFGVCFSTWKTSRIVSSRCSCSEGSVSRDSLRWGNKLLWTRSVKHDKFFQIVIKEGQPSDNLGRGFHFSKRKKSF